MSPLPQSDSRFSHPEINTPIALTLPSDLLQGKTTSYQCEVIIPITLKLPIVLEIEISTRSPLCDSSGSEPTYSTSHSIESTSPESASPESTSPSNTYPVDSENYSQRIELEHAESQNNQSQLSPTETVQSDKNQSLLAWLQQRKLTWLLNQIRRYLRPNTTLTMIVLGAFLGTACSSIVVMQRLESQAELESNLELLTQPGTNQPWNSAIGLNN